MVTKEQVDMYLGLAREHIARATIPLNNKIKELKKQVKEQKEQMDHKDEIIIHKDKIRVQQKQSIDELTRELKRVVLQHEWENSRR